MALGPLEHVRAIQNPVVEKLRGRYYGEYMGFVRDRNDPEKRGRVRIHVPAILGPKPNSVIDWCLSSGSGLSVPPLGATVFVTFEQGFVSNGIYRWGWLKGTTIANSDTPLAGKELDDPTWVLEKTGASGGFGVSISATIPQDPAKATKPQYPFNKVYQSEGGFIFEVDDSPDQKRLRIFHPAGTTLLIDADGSVHVHSKGAQYHHCQGDYVIMLDKGATFKVVYNKGPGLAVGSNGITMSGQQVQILNRTVLRSGDPLGQQG